MVCPIDLPSKKSLFTAFFSEQSATHAAKAVADQVSTAIAHSVHSSFVVHLEDDINALLEQANPFDALKIVRAKSRSLG